MSYNWTVINSNSCLTCLLNIHRKLICIFVALCIIRYNNARQWLNIDLGTISRVKRIATQGRYDGDNWVTSYTVGYSMDNIRFIPYKEGRKIRVRLPVSCFCLHILSPAIGYQERSNQFCIYHTSNQCMSRCCISFAQLRGNSLPIGMWTAEETYPANRRHWAREGQMGCSTGQEVFSVGGSDFWLIYFSSLSCRFSLEISKEISSSSIVSFARSRHVTCVFIPKRGAVTLPWE